MKSRFFTFLLSLAFFSTSFAQEVPEVQKTLLTKIAATWCSNCGGWGWTFFEDIIEANAEKAVFINAHHSGDLLSPTGLAFATNFEAPYQPYFYAGNQDLDINGGNIDTKPEEVKELVDANYLLAPVANVGFEAILDNNTLTLNTKTKFFQEASGDFYMGLYILEHHVVNNQSNNSTMALHPYVLRTSITGEDFGELIVNGTATADSEYTGTYSIDLNEAWSQDSLIVAGIIWEKIEDTYQFVNVNTIEEFDAAPVSVSTIPADVLNVELYPTLATASTQLNLDLKEQSLKVNIQLFDLNGQAVQQIFQGELSNGTQSIQIPTAPLNAGLYFVNIQTEDGAMVSKKLIVK